MLVMYLEPRLNSNVDPKNMNSRKHSEMKHYFIILFKNNNLNI